MNSSRNRRLLGIVAGLVVALLVVVFSQAGDGDGAGTGSVNSNSNSNSNSTSTSTSTSTSDVTAPASSDGTAPAWQRCVSSPVARIGLDELPPEARTVLALVETGGPFEYDQDGSTFQNREGLLPDHDLGYYREYTVPTPGASDRGARRIVGGECGDRWYTADHYDSFALIEVGT